MLTPKQKKYFDDLAPGTTVAISSAGNPKAFLEAAKFYIDNHGHSIVLNEGHTEIRKLHPLPKIPGETFF